MYNGIGLQTPRGSGTNGYIQTSKFFIKSRPPVRPDPAASGSKPEGAIRKPNKDILEHDRKRQIQLKLVVLQETLTDQGYTEAEIAEKLEETKKTLEAESAAAAAGEDGGSSGGRRGRPPLPNKSRFADTQSHHIAARKEKQMETLRAALGIKDEKKSSEDEQQGQIVLDEEEDLEPGEFVDDESEQEKRCMISDERQDKNQNRKSMNKMEKHMGEAQNESRKSGIDKSKHQEKHSSKGKYVSSDSESSESIDEKKKKHRRSNHHHKIEMAAIERREKKKHDYSDSDSDTSGDFGQRQPANHKKKLESHSTKSNSDSHSEDELHKRKPVQRRTGTQRHDLEYSDSENHLDPKKHRRDRERVNMHVSAVESIKKEALSNKQRERKSKRHDSDSEDDNDIKNSSRLMKEKLVKSSRRDNIRESDSDSEKKKPIDRKRPITRRHDTDDSDSESDYASTIKKRLDLKKGFEDVSNSDIKGKNEIRKSSTDRHDKPGKLSEKRVENISRKRQHHDLSDKSLANAKDTIRRSSSACHDNRKRQRCDTDESYESDSSLEVTDKRATKQKVSKRKQSSLSEDSESQISESSSDSYSSDSSDDSMEISHKGKSYKDDDRNMEKKNAMQQKSAVDEQKLRHRLDIKSKSDHGSDRFQPKQEGKDFSDYGKQGIRRERKGEAAEEGNTMPRSTYLVEDEREKVSERRLYRNYEDKKRKVDSIVKDIYSKDAKEDAIDLGHRRYIEKESFADTKRGKHQDNRQYSRDVDQHCHKEDSSKRRIEGPISHHYTEDSSHDRHTEDYGRRRYMEDFGQRDRTEDSGKHDHAEDSSRRGPAEESGWGRHTENSGRHHHAEDVDRHHHSENIGSRRHSEHRDRRHYNEEERRQRR